MREKKNHHRLLSTNRHLSQGATEVKRAVWCEEDLSLHITSDLIADERYRMAIYVPDGYIAESCTSGSLLHADGNIATVSIAAPVGDDFDFVIRFSKK